MALWGHGHSHGHSIPLQEANGSLSEFSYTPVSSSLEETAHHDPESDNLEESTTLSVSSEKSETAKEHSDSSKVFPMYYQNS